MRATRPAEYVLEIVTPRTNAARLSPAEHLFATIGGHATVHEEPVAFEIVGDAEGRRFLVRCTSRAQQQQLAAQLGGAYPQAELRPVNISESVADAALLGPDDQVAAATLRLRLGPHLPLRMVEDRDVDAGVTSAQADPLLAVLGAMANLPAGWRVMAQLVVLGSAPTDWARAHQRLALERPVEQDRQRASGPSLVGPLALLGLLLAILFGVRVLEAWDQGDWVSAAALVAAVGAVVSGGLVLARWLKARPPVDPRLVQAKLSRDACEVELRLAVFAPQFVAPDAVIDRLERLATAYRTFTLPAGNSLVPVTTRLPDMDLRVLAAIDRPSCLTCANWRASGTWFRPTTM